jgi:hypothetical protein
MNDKNEKFWLIVETYEKSHAHLLLVNWLAFAEKNGQQVPPEIQEIIDNANRKDDDENS